MKTESENLDPLRQKPDCDELFNPVDIVRALDGEISGEKDFSKRLDFVNLQLDLRTKPLHVKIEQLQSRIRELEEDRDKFAIGFTKFVTHYDMDLRNPDKTYTELLELYKESLLNQKP